MTSWIGVELRHLSVLSAVAEERSFRGAADRLGFVQSAVSQRIPQLEVAVGIRLVERSRGHKDVDMTAAGATLVRHADRIDAQLRAARSELSCLSEESSDPGLKVGALSGPVARLVPPAVVSLRRSAPELRIGLRESSSERELFAAVETGELDVACAELPLEGGPFESRAVTVDPLVALAPSHSRLARSRPLPSLAELAAEPLIIDSNWRMFDRIATEFAAAGLELDVRFEVASGAAMRGLVEAGLGVGIAPQLDVEQPSAATIVIDLESVLPSRTLACFWSPECQRPDEIARFVGAMRPNGAPAPVR